MVEVDIDWKIQRLEEDLADINSGLKFYKQKKLYLKNEISTIERILGESLTDTAEQVSDMVKNLDTSIIFRQLVDFEGCDETGKPNNFYEIVRLTDAYEKDLKALSARLNEAVGEGDV